MAKAGYDPNVAVMLWEKASKKKGERYSIFSTHPPSGERADYLKEILPQAMEYYEQAKDKYKIPEKKKEKGKASKKKTI